MASELEFLVRQNYANLIASLQQAGQLSADTMTQVLSQYGMTPADFFTWVGTSEAQRLGFNMMLNANGTVRAYQFLNPQGALVPTANSEIAPSINSNLGQATNSAARRFTSMISANTALNALDLILTFGTVDRYVPETPVQQALAFSTRVSPAMQIASVGARLGKAIDGGLYSLLDALNLDPPEALNPDTWTGLVSNDDGVLAQAFNWLLALDDDGKAQLYADTDSVAYSAQWLNNQGFFADAESITVDDSTVTDRSPMYYPNSQYQINLNKSVGIGDTPSAYYEEFTITDGYIIVYLNPGDTTGMLVGFSNTPSSMTYRRYINGELRATQTIGVTTATTRVGYTYYLSSFRQVGAVQVGQSMIVPRNQFQPWDVAYLTYNGEVIEESPIEGVSDNGGTKPDRTGWTNQNIPAITQSLQQQYPDWFADALNVQTVQPDGSVKDYTYIPIAPATDVDALGNPDTQGLAYDYDVIDPETATLTQLQTIIEALTESMEKTQTLTNPELNPNPQALPNGSNQTNPTNTDKNPQDTGTGTANVVPLPTGNASSLWAVYHPSQAQLNAFGAWLWSSDFVEQLKRLFNDPMQAIIGVHKVFAPIPTGGSQNIKCGYLDSGVSSPVVSAQYTEVNCGTVDCREYFGNVFDYDPHTRVSIYLPFIGVVPLKVSEVMRASITVTYGVDVITGACLAKVKVDRDGGGAILYSFGGSCACHYPISAGSYAGIISGIVTSAVGVAGGIMTGNPLAAAGGVLAGARQAHTDVQHSGGFTGCAGAMGPKIPYLIITRPQTRVANNVQLYEGKPSNATQFIGDCIGFVRATEVHFSSQAAFDDEAKEVEALLKSGVLISD